MKKKITCSYENTEKYIVFSVPIQKEVTGIDRNGEEVTETISYRLQIIDSAKFMTSSSASPVNNLAEGIHKIKCKYGHDDKKCETCRIK